MVGLRAGRGKERRRHVKVIKGSRARRQMGESPERKPRLPVTCGNKKGVLHKDRFNKGKQCIFSNGQWFTPGKFEKFGGKEKNKKWKTSIFYKRIGLHTLIQDGVLSSPSFKVKHSQGRKKLIGSRRSTRLSKDRHASESDRTSDWSSDDDDDDDDGDDDNEEYYNGDEDDGEDDEENEDGNKGHYNADDGDEDDAGGGGDAEDIQVNKGAFSGDSFNVTCSQGKGVLHVSRFATEACGKCIRTQDAWLTPKDFLNQNKPGGNWRRDIDRVLEPHMVNCKCPVCTQEPLHLLDQNNDDTCFKCSMDGDLVCCDKCPRAFHHQCHEPVLRDDTVGEHWTCSFCTLSVPAARNQSC